MSAPFNNESSAKSALWLLGLGGVLVGLTIMFPHAAVVGFLVIAVAYWWLSTCFEPNRPEVFWLRAATGLQLAAAALHVGQVALLFFFQPLDWLSPMAFTHSIGIGFHLLAFAAYLRMLSLVMPALRYVTPARQIRMNAMAVIACIGGLAAMALPFAMFVVSAASFLMMPVFAMALLVFLWERAGDDPTSGRSSLFGWGVLKVVVGVIMVACCTMFLVLSFDDLWRYGEHFTYLLYFSLPAAIGLRWITTGWWNLRGAQLAFWKSLLAGVLCAAVFYGAGRLAGEYRLRQWEQYFWSKAENGGEDEILGYYNSAPRTHWRPEAVARIIDLLERKKSSIRIKFKEMRRSIYSRLERYYPNDARFDKFRAKTAQWQDEELPEDVDGETSDGVDDGDDFADGPPSIDDDAQPVDDGSIPQPFDDDSLSPTDVDSSP